MPSEEQLVQFAARALAIHFRASVAMVALGAVLIGWRCLPAIAAVLAR